MWLRRIIYCLILSCSVGVIIMKNSDKDYFALFEIERQFNINIDLLEGLYFKLQYESHPDMLADKNKEEILAAVAYSAIINDAYRVLSNDLSRAEYLLSLSDIIVNREMKGIKASQDILEEAIENRENLFNTDDLVAIVKVKNENISAKKQCINDIQNAFENKDYQNAAQLTIKLKYIEKFAEEINIKISGIEDVA